VSPQFDLTGAWSADDGGIYFIRQLPDGSVTWAGLHESGFHMGLEFTNVFQGQISPDGTTIVGEWADVPRGGTMNAGELTLAIIFSVVHGVTVPAELEKIPDGTSGGFGATVWTAGAAELGAHDIETIDGQVQRYDVPLGQNNPPCRDFTVMWGPVTTVNWPTLPPDPSDYCSFMHKDIFGQPSWNGDGDFTFTITPDWSLTESDFWTSGWLDVTRPIPQGQFPASIALAWMYYQFGQFFHCETAMYGRSNDQNHCDDPPDVLLPAWNELDGNSVLFNGLPINGSVSPASDSAGNPALVFYVGPPDRELPLLQTGSFVRVTGVAADDAGHEDQGLPEIHPVYSLEIVDFSERFSGPGRAYPPGRGVSPAPPGRRADPGQPVPVFGQSFNLTGAWHGSDAGTYYLRQIGGTLWWLGLSRDQGRSFANVFRGTISGELINGSWVDVPVGTGGTRDYGNLTIFCNSALTTQLTKVSIDDFGSDKWTKLYDVEIDVPPVISDPFAPRARADE
jgi:hypothetical protein